ncbi:hypothetical protein ABK040_013718 [Willaertia magna]
MNNNQTSTNYSQNTCGENDNIHTSVKEYYGKTLSQTKDLKTNACSAIAKPHPIICELTKLIPDEVLQTFYGCGSPVPLGIKGLCVLDLGSGSGKDLFLASLLSGSNGKCIGIDMTEEQLDIANRNKKLFIERIGNSMELAPIEFVHGYIEEIEKSGIQNESVDLVISNCVVNLSSDKHAVIKGVFNVLKYGGEFVFSDMYCDRRIPESLKKDKVLLGEGLAGALYINDFLDLCRKVGFIDPRQVTKKEITIFDEQIKNLVGNAKYYSITFRLFKTNPLPELFEEDYGQLAIYNGGIDGFEHNYQLDQNYNFITGKPQRICGNTAIILTHSWLSKYFNVIGDQSVHYGKFTN